MYLNFKIYKVQKIKKEKLISVRLDEN